MASKSAEFELSPPPLPALTGARFIAAFCVVLAHACAFMENVPRGEPLWHSYGATTSAYAMSQFFVLSGFVIHYNYADQIVRYRWRGVANFFVARFARLYPLYIICALFILFDHGDLYLWGTGAEPDRLQKLLVSLPYMLTLTQSWVYKIYDGSSLIYQYPWHSSLAVAWSISTEWFFYFVYPFICLPLARIKRKSVLLGLALLVSIVALTEVRLIYVHAVAINAYAGAHFGPVATMEHGYQDSFFRWLVYFSPYVRMFEFLLGCLTAALYRNMSQAPVGAIERRIGATLTWLAVFSFFAIDGVMFRQPTVNAFLTYLHQNYGFAIPSAVFLFCVVRYDTAVSRALAASWILLLGEASYSIYLLHGEFLELAGLSVLPIGVNHYYNAINLMRAGLAMAALMAVSVATYRFVESPTRRFIRRTLSLHLPRRAVDLAPAVAQSEAS